MEGFELRGKSIESHRLFSAPETVETILEDFESSSTFVVVDSRSFDLCL